MRTPRPWERRRARVSYRRGARVESPDAGGQLAACSARLGVKFRIQGLIIGKVIVIGRFLLQPNKHERLLRDPRCASDCLSRNN